MEDGAQHEAQDEAQDKVIIEIKSGLKSKSMKEPREEAPTSWKLKGI